MKKGMSQGVRKDGNLKTSMPAMTKAPPMRHSKEGSLVSGYSSDFGVGAKVGSRTARSASKPKRSKMY
jgi:hypothetical protein